MNIHDQFIFNSTQYINARGLPSNSFSINGKYVRVLVGVCMYVCMYVRMYDDTYSAKCSYVVIQGNPIFALTPSASDHIYLLTYSSIFSSSSSTLFTCPFISFIFIFLFPFLSFSSFHLLICPYISILVSQVL